MFRSCKMTSRTGFILFLWRQKGARDTMSCLQEFLRLWQKLDIIYTGNSKEFMIACRDLQWNHDTSAPHRSETNRVADRAVRRVKEGTAIALVQSGLPEAWRDRARECHCYFAQRARQMADNKTHSRNDLVRNLTDHQSPLEHWVEYIPITAKDKSSTHQLKKQTLCYVREEVGQKIWW